MKRFGATLIFQIIGLIIVIAISAFAALTLFGAPAGVFMAAYPKQVFDMTAPVTCPGGAVKFEEYHTSYDHPGENQFNATCTMPDGSQKDVTLQAIGYEMGGSYLTCFLPVCCPLSLLVFFAPMLLARTVKKSPPQGPVGSF